MRPPPWLPPCLAHLAAALSVCGATTGAAAAPGAPIRGHREPLRSGDLVELTLDGGERIEGAYTGTVTPSPDDPGRYTIVEHEDWRPLPPNSYAVVDRNGFEAVALRDVGRARVHRQHTHDGLQLRGTLSGGILELQTRIGTRRLIANGPSGGFELFGGLTPATGLTVGGYLSHSEAVVTSARKGEDDSYRLGFAAVGPYVDYYAEPRGGFHVMGTLGFSGLGQPGKSGFALEGLYGAGVALGAGAGYDFWIADEWSAGFLFRAGRAWLDSGYPVDDGTVDLATVSFSLAYQ